MSLTIICDCGWGSAKGGGDIDSFISHVRGKHGVDVRLGNIHWAHCNDCTKSNGHGRRLSSVYSLIDHLEEMHGVCAQIIE